MLVTSDVRVKLALVTRAKNVAAEWAQAGVLSVEFVRTVPLTTLLS
jgi:hypothetical protein